LKGDKIMLTHPTLDKLCELGLHGMVKGFEDLEAQPEARARVARLRHDAQVEDVDFRAYRGLDRTLFLQLTTWDWIRKHHGLRLTGPASIGKSWLACALGQKACREDFSVAYHRAP
jgi:DNA replication protein DnaC